MEDGLHLYKQLLTSFDIMDDDASLVFFAEEHEDAGISSKPPWKIILVDDEPSIHQVTLLSLKNFEFEGRSLSFIHCYSGEEAKQTMASENDIALMFLDVVMESEHAGLDVASYIRDELKNNLVRIILRTGQPGSAPEASVITQYDINDYKTKTELTSAKLITAVVSALRAYTELQKSESVRNALSKMLANSEVMLEYSNCESFMQNLVGNMTKLLPLAQRFEVQTVAVCLLEVVNNRINVRQKSAEMKCENEEIISLFGELLNRIESAISNQQTTNNSAVHSVVSLQHALLYVCPLDNQESTSSSDGFYVGLQYVNEITLEENQLLLNLANNIRISSSNIKMKSSLVKINQALEEKVLQRTKELQAETQKSEQASQAKSHFLSNMSHEIRTPMNAILGFAQILLRSADINDKQRNTVTKITKAGQHLMEIINDVLEISKIEAGAMTLNSTDFNLLELVTDIGQMFQFRCEQKKLVWKFNNEISSETLVSADQAKIRQILINLLGNAVKFTDEGEISLTLSKTERGQYRFKITDTGPGIDEQEQESLFTNFSQGAAGFAKGGTGLGLAISAKQIELMGGKLKLESSLGKGASFEFCLPLELCDSSKLSLSCDEVEQLRCRSKSSFRALCVDDMAENREVLGALLESCGIEVEYAFNGLEAVELIKEKPFDVVFMDLLMPVMKGDEAIKIIRDELGLANLVCCAVSAFSLIHEVEKYLSMGFDQFIAKPFTFSDVFKFLLKYFPDDFEKPLEEKDSQKESCEVDFSQLSLSRELLNELIDSAKINRTSNVKRILLEVENNNPSIQLYTQQLLSYIDDFDMKSFIQAVECIKNEN